MKIARFKNNNEGVKMLPIDVKYSDGRDVFAVMSVLWSTLLVNLIFDVGDKMEKNEMGWACGAYE